MRNFSLAFLSRVSVFGGNSTSAVLEENYVSITFIAMTSGSF